MRVLAGLNGLQCQRPRFRNDLERLDFVTGDGVRPRQVVAHITLCGHVPDQICQRDNLFEPAGGLGAR
jgi:hypothetical protein